MEVGEHQPLSLAASMPARQPEWAALVDRFGLTAPADLATFVGQSFIYADLICGYGLAQSPPPSLVSTFKIRRAGFADCMDTEDMFRALIARFQANGWLPPARW